MSDSRLHHSMSSSTLLAIATVLGATTLVGFNATADDFAVFKSSDHGRSWIRSDSGMPGQSRINAFGSADGLLFAGTDAGIFISSDEARHWQPAAGAALTSGRILSFAVLGRKAYAGTDARGLLASSDGGRTWAVEAAFPSQKVRCLIAHGNRIHAGTDANGVWVSNGSGQPWSRLSDGLPNNSQIFALAVVRGKLFAGLYSQGLYAMDERQHSWVKTGPVTPLALAGVEDALIAGHNPGGLFSSGDQGASWSKGEATVQSFSPLSALQPDDSGELSPDAPVWELGANDEGLVFAGASAGIYYSEDRGRTWNRARHGLPEKSPGIAFLLKRDFVLAGTLTQQDDAGD